MLDQKCLTFIEVRYRVTATFSPPPTNAVGQHKQRKIILTTAMIVARYYRFSNFTMRFDVVAIEGHSGEWLEWLKDAFRPINSNL